MNIPHAIQAVVETRSGIVSALESSLKNSTLISKFTSQTMQLGSVMVSDSEVAGLFFSIPTNNFKKPTQPFISTLIDMSSVMRLFFHLWISSTYFQLLD